MHHVAPDWIVKPAAGSRSKVYAFMFSAGLAGMSIGPCAAAATFAITGNAWQVKTLEHVILVGMVLATIPIATLLCFNDDKSLGAESDALRHQHTQQTDNPAGRQKCCFPALTAPLWLHVQFI